MVEFDNNFEIYDTDLENEEKELVEYYENKTNKKLYPAQSEKIMISIIAYAKHLVMLRFQECIKNLLLPYAKGIWLDILGFLVGCIRIAAAQSKSTLKVTLYQEFSFDKTLPKGSEIETNDGDAIFTTDEDLIIPAGETVGYVGITSAQAGSVLNYKSGEITSLLQNYEFIESVENITNCEGGSDEEEDDAYRERIASAPERFSTAGPEEAYKYHIMSAHKDITDCSCVLPDDSCTLKIGSNTYIEENNEIVTPNFIATVNYNSCSVTFPSGTSLTEDITIKFPKQGELNWYILTKDGIASQTILDTVEKYVSSDDKRPLTDYVKYFSAIPKTFELAPIIYIENNADFESTKQNVINTLNGYLESLKKSLNGEILPMNIYNLIGSVGGVYNVDLNGFGGIKANKTEYLNGSISGSIEFRRVV